MPTIVTRGTASARAFGFGRTPTVTPSPPPPGPPPPPPPPEPTLQTVVFDSSTSWTAPFAVNQLISVTLTGGAYTESGGGWAYTAGGFNFAFYSQTGTAQAGRVEAFYSYAQAGEYADSQVALINSGGTGERNATFYPIRSFYNPNTGGYYTVYPDPVTQRVRGVATPASGPWDNRSSSPVQGIGNGWYFGIEVYYPPTGGDGTPSSAFGYSVAGGTASTSPGSATYYNVNISGGATYTIDVGSSGGSVVIQFYQ